MARATAAMTSPPALPYRPAGRPRLFVTAVVLLCLACGTASAAALAGRRLDEVLREFSSRGLQLIYNGELVPEGLLVLHEPHPGAELDVLQQLLAEHGLRANPVGNGVYAIVRQSPPARTIAPAAPASVPLENIVVTASRYSLANDIPGVRTFLTQTELEALPRFADDALKAVHRLPGAASNGLSGLAHMRGGDENETQVIFDGLPLFEPFHLRLLQSPVSVLDERVVDGIEVYAGGFTAEYGDRMSAIIDARSVHPSEDAHYELGLGLFHTTALAAHRFDDGRGQWLVSLRRSNLDGVSAVLDSDLGQPRYADGFARVDYAFSDDTRGSLHMLLSSDKAEVTNTARTEQATARYANSYVWATLEHDWSPQLTGRALASFTDVSSERDGTVNEPDLRTGRFDDRRDYDVLGLKLDATYTGERWLHRFGVEARSLDARYEYAGSVTFAPGYPFPDSPGAVISRALAPRPSGQHYSAYLTSRVRVTDALTAEVGVRWDEETYSPDSDNEIGPRANLVWNLSAATRLRASWGRYQQFQGIEELQVQDGVDQFQRAQHADHAILGFEHDFSDGYALRVEAYRKSYGQPMTRFETLFDPLSLAPELRWDRAAIAPGSARADGTEILFTRRGAGPWSGWASYAWSRVTDREDGRDVVRSWDQTHTVNAGVTWVDGPWQVTLAGMYHTGWPVTPVLIVPGADGDTAALGPRNANRYADFGSLDFKVNREFALPRGSLDVRFEVTNALDRHNPCCVDYTVESEAGGTVVVESDFRDWLPLVPSFGVLWKF
jgi:hypothetical protein